MSKGLKIVILLLVLAAGGVGIGLYMFNKPHTDLDSVKVDAQLSAVELYTAFETDEAASNEKYLDKIVEVNGVVAEKTETEGGGATLILRPEDAMAGINCEFVPEDAASIKEIKVGDEIQVRGICTGMLLDVNLSRCVLVN